MLQSQIGSKGDVHSRWRPGFLARNVAWKSTLADPKTRTVKIRAEIPDAEGKWYANTYGSGRIILREEPGAVSVPTESIQFDGAVTWSLSATNPI